MDAVADLADMKEWVKQQVQPRLRATSSSVTVALMTPTEFQESWELPLSVCLSSGGRFKRLGFGARALPRPDSDDDKSDEASVAKAVHHIWKPNIASSERECLYLWPGDQSQKFEGYPTENPLPGPFTEDRLKTVFRLLHQVLVDNVHQSAED